MSKLNYFYSLVQVIVLCLSFPLFAEASDLSEKEVRQIEAKIRQNFGQQRRSVENSLERVGKDLDAFLFGPEVSNNLLVFYNQQIKPGNKSQEELWELFKEQVLNKKRFDAFIDELIETHFRVFDKARREVNRDLIGYGLDGVGEQNYKDIKSKLKEDIDRIWNVQAEKMRGVLNENVSGAVEANRYRRQDDNINYFAVGSDVVGAVIGINCPPCAIVLNIVSAAVFGGWHVFKTFVLEIDSGKLIETGQQQFVRKMQKHMQILSEKIQNQFRSASEVATERLFDAIRQMVVEAYPQIRLEELR